MDHLFTPWRFAYVAGADKQPACIFCAKLRLRKLPDPGAQEMMTLTRKLESILREVYIPDGINLGMNIGKAAGAGVAGHIHMHVLPRWFADANFMSVIGETRVVPESLEETYRKIRQKF